MYCHLKKSSIIVRVGDEVKAGDKLAQIGLSGNTEFPHLHLTLWKGKEKLDPFTADSINAPCGKKQIKGLWKKLIPYTPTAILGDGFVDAVPKVNAMRDTPSNLSQISATAPVIAYWVELMGTRQGDQLSFSITQPDGKELASVRQTVKKSQAVFFQFIGKRNRTGLAAGKYQAKFTLARAGKPLLSAQREVFVK
jgi:hypothetical protein